MTKGEKDVAFMENVQISNDDKQSSGSITTATRAESPDFDEISDTSLKLG